MDHFSETTIAKIGIYVYALVDPRNNEVFYIGKGAGNRVFEHEKEENTGGSKHMRIMSIKSDGQEVKKLIVLHNINDNDIAEKRAYTTEAALINLMRFISPKSLTNSVSGHHAYDGAMTVEQIENLYGAPVLAESDIKPEDKVLTVKINALYDFNMTDEALMDAVRGHWKINKNCDAKYIAGVYKGVIVAIYKIEKWHSSEVLDNNYCRKEEFGTNPGRQYCSCSALSEDDEIYKRYMNKDISAILKQQNPVKYLY